MTLPSTQENLDLFHEDISEYVAQLQLHMTLQARNLVPSLDSQQITQNENKNQNQVEESRQQLLAETQANVEKLVSRQEIWACRL